MDIFSIAALSGGAAFFLFGIKVLSYSLEKSAGSRLERALKRVSGRHFSALLLGVCATAAVQSSSAVTVMLMGLVDSGVSALEDCVPIIAGSNIGTTATAWIMSSSQLSAGSASALSIEALAPFSAAAGIALLTLSKKERPKDVGTALLGFALMINGMEIMKTSAEPMSDSALFTAAVQSSSAGIAFVQAMAAAGTVSASAAVPIIAGQNIGTCATAAIASLGVNKNAKRAALIHILFNIIGSAFFLALYYVLRFVSPEILEISLPPAGIALIHTLFNLCASALLLPFSNRLCALSKRII